MTALFRFPLFVASSFLAAAHAQQPAETKLEFLPSSMPALRAYLGDPSTGAPLPARGLKIVWHPAGRLFVSNVMESIPEQERIIQVWAPPTDSQPARHKGCLNASGAWAISNQGDLLCAQAFEYTKSGLDGGPENRAVSCYRFKDASKIWKYEVKENERIRAVCFGKDDRKVLVAVVEGGLCTLRLLDSATGAEEKKIAIPGDLGRCPSSSSIVMVNEDFIVLTARQETSSLLYVQTDPWASSLASFHEFPGQYL